jgi:hypothetical protein
MDEPVITNVTPYFSYAKIGTNKIDSQPLFKGLYTDLEFINTCTYICPARLLN